MFQNQNLLQSSPPTPPPPTTPLQGQSFPSSPSQSVATLHCCFYGALKLWNHSTCPRHEHFLISQINGKPVGRIVIGLYGDSAPVGAARFSSLASGTAGISYRRKEFSKIMPNYVRHSGCPGPKNLAGTVSIIIRHPSKPSPKLKLVARKGKLEIDQEEVESWKDGGCRKGRTSEDCAGKYYSIFQGGKDSRRQKGCCGGKRLQPNRSYSKLVITNCGLMD
ncbi:hypothetical protein ACOSQ4_007182 [Xanthoceras sorbifolium]